MNKSSEIKDFVGDRWVMVVDPSTNFRDSIRRFLNNVGVKKIKLVSSASEGRKMLINGDFALFFVEWILPDQSGLEFCRSIRQQKKYADAPFILMTSENLRSDVMLATEAGIDRYLLKPFAYDQFCEQTASSIKESINPSAMDKLFEDAERRFRYKDYPGAEKVLFTLLDERPNSARALCWLGRIFVAKGALEQAIEYFERAILCNPDFLEAYSYLIDAYEQKQDAVQLQSVTERAHALSPDNPKYTLLLAKIYFEGSDIKRAEQLFKRTISLSPKLSEAYKGLGNVQFEKSEYEKAIKNYKKALDLAPADLSVLNALGLAYVKKELIVQGIDYYKMALRIDGTDWRVLFNIGYAHEKLGDDKLAANFYERALAANPDLEKAERRLRGIRTGIKVAG